RAVSVSLMRPPPIKTSSGTEAHGEKKNVWWMWQGYRGSLQAARGYARRLTSPLATLGRPFGTTNVTPGGDNGSQVELYFSRGGGAISNGLLASAAFSCARTDSMVSCSLNAFLAVSASFSAAVRPSSISF